MRTCWRYFAPNWDPFQRPHYFALLDHLFFGHLMEHSSWGILSIYPFVSIKRSSQIMTGWITLLPQLQWFGLFSLSFTLTAELFWSVKAYASWILVNLLDGQDSEFEISLIHEASIHCRPIGLLTYWIHLKMLLHQR